MFSLKSGIEGLKLKTDAWAFDFFFSLYTCKSNRKSIWHSSIWAGNIGWSWTVADGGRIVSINTQMCWRWSVKIDQCITCRQVADMEQMFRLCLEIAALMRSGSSVKPFYLSVDVLFSKTKMALWAHKQSTHKWNPFPLTLCNLTMSPSPVRRRTEQSINIVFYEQTNGFWWQQYHTCVCVWCCDPGQVNLFTSSFHVMHYGSHISFLKSHLKCVTVTTPLSNLKSSIRNHRTNALDLGSKYLCLLNSHVGHTKHASVCSLSDISQHCLNNTNPVNGNGEFQHATRRLKCSNFFNLKHKIVQMWGLG